MILPVGHESDTVRRIPWITIAIIVLCLVAHIFISRDIKNSEQELKKHFIELFQYYFEHPYLELNPEIKKLFFAEDAHVEELQELYKKYNKQPGDEQDRLEEQEQLDNMTGKVKLTIENIPYRKWGLIPAKKKLKGLLAHIFIHGDWMHLIGNLLLLYLTGPFIEDVWGRSAYITFYLLMGMFSALMFSAHYPHFNGPLIGASGAIAGLMGAFLIRFWKTKIKFVYFFIFPVFIRGSFKSPAWVMLPLWLFIEFFNAKTIDSINPQGGGGVAHWAHVWGFAFGVITAVMIRVLRVEARFINPKILTKTSYVNETYKKYENILHLIEKGSKKEAYEQLMAAVDNDPAHVEMGETLWKIGQEINKTEDAARVFLKVIEREIKMNRIQFVLDHYLEIKKKVPGLNISTQSKIMLISYLIEHEAIPEAREIFRTDIIDKIEVNYPPGQLLQLSDIALKIEPGMAEKVIGIALQHPDIPEFRKKELQVSLKKINPVSKSIPDQLILEHSAIPMVETAEDSDSRSFREKKIKATRITPISIKNEMVVLNIEKIGKKFLPLGKIKVISVVRIENQFESPYLLIDLFLDDPLSQLPEIRSLRISSRDFNPHDIIPAAKNLLEAFRIFIYGMLELSKAKPFPDMESIQLKKFSVFQSVEAYENSFRNAF